MRPFIIENCKSKTSRASRWLLGEEKFNSGCEPLSMSFLFLINWKVSQFQICIQKMIFKGQSNILHKNVFFLLIGIQIQFLCRYVTSFLTKQKDGQLKNLGRGGKDHDGWKFNWEIFERMKTTEECCVYRKLDIEKTWESLYAQKGSP